MAATAAVASPPPVARPKALKLLVVTWNVGNAEPKELQMLVRTTTTTTDRLDVIVLGLQEARYRSTQAHRVHEHGDFFDRIKAILGQTWYPARTRALGEMQLGVFVRQELKPFVHDIHAAVERTGVADIGSNKGGIAIRLCIGNTSLGFVSSHLAAHEGKSMRGRQGAHPCARVGVVFVRFCGGVLMT